MSDSLAGLDTWRRAAAEAGARATAVIARLTRSSQNWPTNTATRDDLGLKESGLTTVVREASGTRARPCGGRRRPQRHREGFRGRRRSSPGASW